MQVAGTVLLALGLSGTVAGGLVAGLGCALVCGWGPQPGYVAGMFAVTLLPGLAVTGTGIGLRVAGNKRERVWLQHRYQPAVSFVPTRHGWAGGVSFRF
jgi:hypothetical protein